MINSKTIFIVNSLDKRLFFNFKLKIIKKSNVMKKKLTGFIMGDNNFDR